jgi:hypothetical protein
VTSEALFALWAKYPAALRDGLRRLTLQGFPDGPGELRAAAGFTALRHLESLVVEDAGFHSLR